MRARLAASLRGCAGASYGGSSSVPSARCREALELKAGASVCGVPRRLFCNRRGGAMAPLLKVKSARFVLEYDDLRCDHVLALIW